MNLINSLLLGSEGSYNFGIKVNFKKKDDPVYSFATSIFPFNMISGLAETLLKNKAFQVLSLGYVHTFVHEMGHALACKILTGTKETCTIYTSNCSGQTTYSFRGISKIKDTMISLAGPLADVIFSVGLVFASFALSTVLWQPICTGICIGAAAWIVGEFVYAAYSTVRLDSGDFGRIARNGTSHWVVSAAALTAPVALTILCL